MAWYWRNFYRKRRYRPYRRNWFKSRRPRKTIRRRRRRHRVRRKRFYKYRLKKLKTIVNRTYQPEKIRKCHIKGFLQLIECGYGRLSDNYTLFKESIVPPHEPGGGGWSIQQLTLGNLYVQGKYAMNYWTYSNKGLNLCRFLGVKITLYRQPDIDYIFHYNLQDPQIITKYTYPSYHPFKILNYHQKIVVPSWKTQPLKRKAYKTKFIRPPKKLKNDWYFQEHLSNYPLLTFFTTAIDLQNMFIPKRAQNNNVSLITLNTRLFNHPNFATTTGTTGFSPSGNNYLYAYTNPDEPWKKHKLKEFIFLGTTTINTPGTPMNGSASNSKWGNPFYYEHLQMHSAITVQTANVTTAATSETDIEESALKKEPLIYELRYNPNKDNGDGNEAYWVTNFNPQIKNWDPPTDQDLILRGHPLWLMLWGFASYLQKTGKFNKLDQNGILVIRTNQFAGEKLPAYVLISDSFYNGQGPYEQNAEEMSTYNLTHWYPRWQFQKEAIEKILMTGPAVYKENNANSIQAYMKYDFLFKWGGNPSKMETIADPNQQPTGPDPNNIFGTNENISPEQTIENYIYKWDVRRDLLTQTATKRITEIPILKQTVFSDGQKTSTDTPFQQIWTPQTEETPKEEDQTLLQQLQLLQQHNQQLEYRLRQLTTIMDEQ